MSEEIRGERFGSDGEGITIIEPLCKTCKYAIDNGVYGCEEDWQTLEIKFGYDECEFWEARE